MISSITRLKTSGLSLLLAVTMLPATATAQTRPSILALQSQITSQQAEIATLQTQVASGTVPNIAGYLTMDLSTPTRPTLRVAGANLQVVNGLGMTASTNGLGNVIVGYDEASGLSGLPEACSLGLYVDQISCQSDGYTWAVEHKEGSHNLVVGPNNRYSRFGGLVAGQGNTINHDSASISGGNSNTASGAYASVSGGTGNTASNQYASVSGGLNREQNMDFYWTGGSLTGTP